MNTTFVSSNATSLRLNRLFKLFISKKHFFAVALIVFSLGNLLTGAKTAMAANGFYGPELFNPTNTTEANNYYYSKISAIFYQNYDYRTRTFNFTNIPSQIAAIVPPVATGSWTVPPSVTKIVVSSAGGSSISGVQITNNPGNSTDNTISVTPGDTYYYQIGSSQVTIFNAASGQCYQSSTCGQTYYYYGAIPATATWLSKNADGSSPIVINPASNDVGGVGITQFSALIATSTKPKDIYPNLSNKNGYMNIEQVGGPSSVYKIPGTYTWTSPNAVSTFTVKVWGGGGGAGNSRLGSGTKDSPGGSGGGYAMKTFTNVPANTTYKFIVGAGGRGAGQYDTTYGQPDQLGLSGGDTMFIATSSGQLPTNCGGVITYLCATGGGGSSIYTIDTPAAVGVGINGDVNASGTTGDHVGINNHGGLAGAAVCDNTYSDVTTCAGGHQANNPASFVGNFGADNLARNIYASNGAPAPKWFDTQGGDGFTPGNGGGNGTQSLSGGNGGNGMVIIQFASSTPPVPAFSYKLSNSGNKSIYAGQSTSTIISALLTSATTEPVTLSMKVVDASGISALGTATGFSSVGTGVAVGYINPASPATTTTAILQSTSATAPGTYTVSVTGTAADAPTASTTTFTVTVLSDPYSLTTKSLGNGACPPPTQQIDLAWNAYPGASSYNIYRAVGAGPFINVGTVSSTTLKYIDITYTAGYVNTYQVVAVVGGVEQLRSLTSSQVGPANTSTALCTVNTSTPTVTPTTSTSGTTPPTPTKFVRLWLARKLGLAYVGSGGSTYTLTVKKGQSAYANVRGALVDWQSCITSPNPPAYWSSGSQGTFVSSLGGLTDAGSFDNVVDTSVPGTYILGLQCNDTSHSPLPAAKIKLVVVPPGTIEEK